MSQVGKDSVSLTVEELRVLRMASELRERGVLQARYETAAYKLELSLAPPLEPVNELTEEQRQLLLSSDATPEAMKQKLRDEYERDLYAAG